MNTNFLGDPSIKRIFLAPVLFIATTLFAAPMAPWNNVWSTVPQAPLSSVAYGNGLFVAVGNGARCVSQDGQNWGTFVSPPVFSQGWIAYGNQTFVETATNPQNETVIYQTTNGTIFSAVYTNSKSLFGAAYGNGIWVFVGTNDLVSCQNVQTSPNWNEYQPPFSPLSIVFANGSFVIAANYANFTAFFTSVDGIAWEYVSGVGGGAYPNPNGFAFGNGTYVIEFNFFPTNSFPYMTTWSSHDLLNWQATDTGYIQNQSSPYNPSPIVSFGGGQFIKSANYGSGSVNGAQTFFYSLASSADGYSWQIESNNLNLNPSVMAYGQGHFVCISATNLIYESPLISQPTNSSSFPISIGSYAGVTINGMVGATYQIQASTSLLRSNWVAVTNIMLPRSPYLWIDTSSPISANRFYRAVQLQ